MTIANKIYLIDANVLIHAHTLYYPINRVPEFWEWVLFHARNGSLKIPTEILNEIQGGETAVHAAWAHDAANKDCLLLKEEFDAKALQHVIYSGYASDLNDVEIDTIGKDPFLISYAMSDTANRIVVTNEISKPTKQRANRKIPDICNHLGVTWCNVYQLLKDLDFSTDWKKRVAP